jgi:HK97 family phage portal protein
MGTRDLISRGLRTLVRAVEGNVRPGPYILPISGGWLPAGAPTNWWQTGMDVLPIGARSAMVEACVSAYAQTIAMCPGGHWRKTNKGGRDQVSNTALARILKKPNTYQTISDFLLNAVRHLFLDGNAYALAQRNDRYEISELHLMDSRLCKPEVAVTGEVFYRLGGNAVIDKLLADESPLLVPQRDVLHIRLHADRRYPFPLWGQTPLLAALADMSMADAVAQQQINFYINQARPSAVLSTDLPLDKDTVQSLRDRWDEQTRKLNQGGSPILTHGLKVQPWTVGGRDAQIAEMMKMSKENIALVFRIPMAVLGLGDRAGFGSTEALMQFWISTGLGFAISHVEAEFDRLFQLKGQPDEYTEFSTTALLRSAHKDRIEALARGVQSGIYSPNEVRNLEDLDSVGEAGSEPRVQQQIVPLSAASLITPTAHGPKITAPPSPNAPPSAAAVPAPKTEKSDGYDSKRGVERIFSAVQRASRRFN